MSVSGDEFEPVSRTWRSQGLVLNYLDWGNEGAPLLVLIHGNADHARAWDWTARALRADYHVIAPDLRGHGDSAWSPDGAYAALYFLQDFADLIETLGAQTMTLVSHSFGGAVAMRYAALYPERVQKLVIVDGLGPAPAFRKRWEEAGPVSRARDWIDKRREAAAKAPRRFASIEEAAERLRKTNKRLSSERGAHLAHYGVRRDGDAYVWKHDPLVAVFSNEDFMMECDAVKAQVTAPVLLFWGPESWTTHPDEDGRGKAIADHKTIVFQEAGHWVHHDQFDAFIAALQEFLRA